MFQVLSDESGEHDAVVASSAVGVSAETLERFAAELRQAQEGLRAVSIDDVIGLCDVAGREGAWHGRTSEKADDEATRKFLSSWLRRRNLESICDLALRGDRAAIDRFVPVRPGARRLHRAQPRGIVVHWLAGNVPMLGVISVVQGLLSKNANLAKVPARETGALASFLEVLGSARYARPDGEVVEGDVLTRAVRTMYVARDDTASARALSMLADVRVAWGGREAVESVMSLPRRYGTEDIVFGPKTSFAVVGADMLADEGSARRTAQLLALDTVALDQRGCNSPHTVFVERGGMVSPPRFAAILGDELGTACAGRPSPSLSASDAFRGFGLRAEYGIRGEAWHSHGVSWAVLYADDDRGLADPCYGRTLFVRPVDDVFDVVPHCSVMTQTVALALTARRLSLADALTTHGVARCPEPGRMSQYETPWDGMYPIDRMVRWVSA
ncbi:MAG: acyl-CoA reductase [Isosphaeraceae bacterium]